MMIFEFVFMFVDLKLNGEKGVQQENNFFRDFFRKLLCLEFGYILLGILDSTSCLVKQTCSCI